MNAASKRFLLQLLSTPSPTGFEHRGQRLWVQQLRKVADRVESDAYGTAWAVLEGSAKKPRRLMLEAHADEIGYMVKYISKDGFLSLDRIGGSDVATARGRRVEILGDKGSVRGVIGNIAIHIREDRDNEKAPKVHDLWVDLGLGSAEEVAKAGIRVGHPVVYADGVEELGRHRLVGRALDNRIGGFIIAEVMAQLAKGRRPQATVIAVNAVQEEIGGNGATMVAHRLKPDAALVLDVTHATDTPAVDVKKHGQVSLGGGPSITHGSANHPEMVARLMEVAKAAKIPLQHESSSRFTGTDTDSIFIQQGGIPSSLVSLPLRYMHSVVEMADWRDIEQVIELLVGFARSVGPNDDFKVRL